MIVVFCILLSRLPTAQSSSKQFVQSAEKMLLNDLLFPEHLHLQLEEPLFNFSSVKANQSISPNIRFVYNKHARPTLHPDRAVQVGMSLTILRVERLNEKDQILDTEVVIRKEWLDYQLTWEPKDYSGIESIMVPVETIWKPDISLFNNVDSASDSMIDGKHARVSHHGHVTWVSHHFLSSKCMLDMSRFPYDVQDCPLWFGSWTYDVSKLQLDLAKTDYATVFNDKDRHEWFVRPFTATKMQFAWPGHPETYDFLHFNLRMSRSSAYYRYVLFMPGVFLCFLTIFVISLPPESGEKMSLGIGIIIALVLMLTILDTFLPTSMSTVPLIALKARVLRLLIHIAAAYF